METGKNVWFIYEPGANDKMDSVLLDYVKDQILGHKVTAKGARPDRGICISFCKVSPTDLLIFGVQQLKKKRAPKMLVFHECKEGTVKKVLKVVKKFHKHDFQVIVKEGPNKKIEDSLGFKVDHYKDIQLYLTAV